MVGSSSPRKFILLKEDGSVARSINDQSVVAVIDSRQTQARVYRELAKRAKRPVILPYTSYLATPKIYVQQFIKNKIDLDAKSGLHSAVVRYETVKGKPLAVEVLKTARDDLKRWCEEGYWSGDLQFMFELTTGHLYPQDFEPRLMPCLGRQARDMKDFMRWLNNRIGGEAQECRKAPGRLRWCMPSGKPLRHSAGPASNFGSKLFSRPRMNLMTQIIEE